MNRRRIVVTGMGVITPVGNSVPAFWESLIQGASGVGPITKFNAEKFETRFAAEVKNFDPSDYIDKKQARRMDVFTHYALASAEMAFADAELREGNFEPNDAGVVFGSGIGGVQVFQEQTKLYFETLTPQKVSPFFITMLISDIASGHISMRFGLKGPNYSTVSACATASHSIADAFMIIQRGDADVMLCGGSEAPIIELSIAGFNSMRALSTWNDRYAEACRPFDKDRNGFVMGEGAGTLVLEELEHAKKRGAKIYAELRGIGITADAHHITAPEPNGDGAVRAMKRAIKDAGCDLNDIDYINAHGTSTPYNDVTETKAIKTVFENHAYRLAVSSTKSMTGHLLGAAGAIEAVATILSIKHGLIPPTINLTEPGEGCDLDYTPHRAVTRNVKAAISNTFGFGGHNASLLFSRYEDN